MKAITSARPFARLAMIAAALLLFCVQPALAVSVPTPTASGNTSGSTGYLGYVKLTWKKASGAKKYIVYRSASKKWGKRVKLKETKSRTFYDTSAKPGRTYYYWVCPVTSRYMYYNKGKYANGSRGLGTVRPTASWDTYSSCVKVKWGKPKYASYVKKYKVYRADTSNFNSAVLVGTTKKKTRTFNDTSAIAGVAYYYWVCPVGKNGRGWYDKAKYRKGRRHGYTIPAMVIHRYADHITLSWNAVPGAVKYRVCFGPTTSYWDSYYIDTTARSFNDYDYDDTTVRYYWVCPVDKFGDWRYNTSRYLEGYLYP